MVNGTLPPDPIGALPPISAQCKAALPWLGIYHGWEALKGFLAHMHRNLEVVAFGLREVISQGDKAAAFGWFRLHALSTDRTADIAYSILFELRDGLIGIVTRFELAVPHPPFFTASLIACSIAVIHW